MIRKNDRQGYFVGNKNDGFKSMTVEEAVTAYKNGDKFASTAAFRIECQIARDEAAMKDHAEDIF